MSKTGSRGADPPGTWRAVHAGPEGDELAIEIWDRPRRSAGEEALGLPHPDYPDQRHRFAIFDTGPPGNPIRFAAGELSNGVWGFYVLM